MTFEKMPSGKRRATGATRDVVIFLDRAVLGLTHTWTAWIVAAMVLYAGLPFVAPVAMHFGVTPVADVIYSLYAPLCHQMAFRSWFLFGEDTAYPRAEAGLPGTTFEDIARSDPAFAGVDLTTVNPRLILAAKAFRGNPVVGWKVAFCERDVAIYGSIAVFGLAYIIARWRKLKVPYLPFWAYIAFGILPILADGGSQYVANLQAIGLNLNFTRESTPFLRVFTGALFGVANGWLAFPYLSASMQETRALVTAKLTRAGVLKGSETPEKTAPSA